MGYLASVTGERCAFTSTISLTLAGFRFSSAATPGGDQKFAKGLLERIERAPEER